MKTNMTLWKKLALITATVSALATAPMLAQEAQAKAAKAKAPAAEEAPPAETGDGVVNLNTATEEELELLPGVGPSKSAAILAWRKKYGAFKRVEDITKVKGFGHKTMKKLKPYLAVSGPTTLKAKPKAQKKSADDGASP